MTDAVIMVALLIAGILVLAIFAGSFVFIRWRSRSIRRLLSQGTAIETKSGRLDTAFAGSQDAPALLLLHGGLGGWDQALALAADLRLDQTFRILAPSRPGYLRTPVANGRSADDAADLMVALLDALDIDQAHVVGVSGGGPTAVAMAIRHPQRLRSLSMVCAISHRHEQPGMTADSFLGRILFSNVGAWVMDAFSWLVLWATYLVPAFMTRRILFMTDLHSRHAIRADVAALRTRPDDLRWISRLLEHSFPISPRQAGLNNDIAVFAALDDAIAGTIHVPTFVVHGRMDGNVPVAHADKVLAAAPEAESLIIDDASHLLWLHPRIPEVRDRLRHFLQAW